jgi:hypothetical protein
VNVAITGARGFLGRRIAARLTGGGHVVRAVSTRTPPAPSAFEGCDAVIHLAGEPVAQRWTAAVRNRIRASRIDATRALVDAFHAWPPRVLVSASAVGYYGSRGDEVLDESASPGVDFLAGIAVEWEREARRAEEIGMRVVLLRTGVALGVDGGALARMLTPFRWGVGGRLGGGGQWMPWIHADDAAALAVYALEAESLRGAINVTSPNPVTNADFTRELARAVHRPAVFPVPKFALKLLFGQMSQVLLASQRAIPQAALRAGFEFRFPDLRSALADLLTGPTRQKL